MSQNVDARPSDEQLVIAARTGDRDAFGALYDRYAGPLLDFCARQLSGDRERAADVVQESFILANQNLAKLDQPARFRSWLYVIAAREGNRTFRGKQAMVVPVAEVQESADHDAGPEEAAVVADRVALLTVAVGGLEPADRTLIGLYLRGLDSRESARELGQTPAAVQLRIHRAKQRLRSSLGALLVAEKARQDCAKLDQMLLDWDGAFNPLIRKRITRHIARCTVCEDRRNRLVNVEVILALLPLVAALPGLDEILGLNATPTGTLRPLAAAVSGVRNAARGPLNPLALGAALLVVGGLVVGGVLVPTTPDPFGSSPETVRGGTTVSETGQVAVRTPLPEEPAASGGTAPAAGDRTGAQAVPSEVPAAADGAGAADAPPAGDAGGADAGAPPAGDAGGTGADAGGTDAADGLPAGDAGVPEAAAGGADAGAPPAGDAGVPEVAAGAADGPPAGDPGVPEVAAGAADGPPAGGAGVPVAGAGAPVPPMVPRGGFEPSPLTMTVAPGQSVEREVGLRLDAPPQKADVLLAVDTTNGDIVDDLGQAMLFRDRLRQSFPGGVRMALAEVRDYAPGETPYTLRSGLTEDDAQLAAAFAALGRGAGPGGPNAYNRAMFEAASDPALQYGGDTARILVLLGDAAPEDTGQNGRFDACRNTGTVDPGRDGASGTADDITTQAAVEGLRQQGVRLFMMDYGRQRECYGQLSGTAGGLGIEERLVEPRDLHEYVDHAVRLVGDLQVTPGTCGFPVNVDAIWTEGEEPPAGDPAEVPVSRGRIGGPVTGEPVEEPPVVKDFMRPAALRARLAVTVPPAPGTYQCELVATGDGGQQQAVLPVTVTVSDQVPPEPTTQGGPFDPDLAPAGEG